MYQTKRLRKTATILFLTICLSGVAKMRIHENVSMQDFPQRLKDNIEQQSNWEEGFLNVTMSPYNAKADGVTDDTDALQKAIDDAFASNLIVYFPSGTYLVSNQLRCIQPQGDQLPNHPISAKSQRKFGHLLLGCDNSWPTIKLADNSTVNDNILLFFAYINKEGINESSRHYLASIRNFNIDMGDNPEVSAISNSGAQYAVIQNISIHGNFDAGIYRIPGSGGYSANITITGGKVGIRQDEYRPCPTIFGLKLFGQSKYGIELLNSRGALTIAGFEIYGPEDGSVDYSAIYLMNNSTIPEQGAVADLVLKDGTITSQSSKAAILNDQQNVVVENVWCKASKLISSNLWPNAQILNGDLNVWKYINEYVYASAEDEGTVCVDGKFYEHTGLPILLPSVLKDSTPPNNLLKKHLWGMMPSWEDERVNIVGDFGVTPDDDSDDDTPKIQMAIDSVCTPGSSQYGKTLFIPRGYFHLRSTLVLKGGLKMVGAGKNISVLATADDWLPEKPTSMVVTKSDNNDSIKLSDFALFMWNGSVDKGTQNRKYMTLLDVKSNNTILRDVQTDCEAPDWKYNSYATPMLRFSQMAGGKIFGMCADLGTKGAVDDNYCLLAIENTQNPLVFYQTSIEDVSEATTPEEEKENLILLKVDNCSNITLYGFKFEGRKQHTFVKNSDEFSIYGGAGNYWMEDEKRDAIFEFTNTKNIIIANLSHDPKTQLPNKALIKDDELWTNDDHPTVFYKKNNKSTLARTAYEAKYTIYPNPVECFLYLNTPYSYPCFQYSVYNIHGKKVLKGRLSTNNIDCSQLITGAYFLTLQLGDSNLYKSFIKN